MTYKVLFSAPTCMGELTSTKFEAVGEEKAIKDYMVKLSRIIEQPTHNHTGLAMVKKISRFGKVTYEVCAVAKLATNE